MRLDEADRRELAPLVALMVALIRAGRGELHMATDDTPTPMLDPGRGRTRLGRFWVYLGGDLHGPGPPPPGSPKRGDRLRRDVVFEFTRSREGKWPQEWLKDFLGKLQADPSASSGQAAFAGYDALHATGRVLELGCWEHARRKFFEARQTEPSRALDAMGRIQRLYAVERLAREKALDAAGRLALRGEHARPVLGELGSWLAEQQPRLLPKSPLAEAVRYAQNQWTALNRYVEDGEAEIDNNACERAIRTVAIGRRNWLFPSQELGKRVRRRDRGDVLLAHRLGAAARDRAACPEPGRGVGLPARRDRPRARHRRQARAREARRATAPSLAA